MEAVVHRRWPSRRRKDERRMFGHFVGLLKLEILFSPCFFLAFLFKSVFGHLCPYREASPHSELCMRCEREKNKKKKKKKPTLLSPDHGLS